MAAILNLIAIIVIFGLIAGLINAFIPMPQIIKSLLNIVIFIILVIYVLQFFAVIKPILPVFVIFK